MNSKQNKTKKMSGDSIFVLSVISISVLLLIGIVYFGKGEKVEVVNEPVQIDTTNQTTLGDDDAPVEVVQFFDFQCVYCQTWDQEITNDLKTDYIDTGKVKYTLINFPFLGEASERSALLFETIDGISGSDSASNFKSRLMSEALRAEGDLEIFTEENLFSFAEASVPEEDYPRIVQSFEDKEFIEEINIDKDIAQNANVLGTPSVFVNNVFNPNGTNKELLFEEIENELSK